MSYIIGYLRALIAAIVFLIALLLGAVMHFVTFLEPAGSSGLPSRGPPRSSALRTFPRTVPASLSATTGPSWTSW